MNNLIAIVAAILGLILNTALPVNDTSGDIIFNGRKYSLAYSDDFDFFDSDKWAYCPEQERQDAGGAWRDCCTTVSGGNLVISCGIDGNGTPISGGIRSTGDYERTFGLYHIRFKAENADGLWYAFWLLTDKMSDSTVGNGASDGAELDIIELVPHTQELCMSVHWDGYGAGLKSVCELTHVDDSFYDEYHDLWYLWDPNGYHLYIDGKCYFDFPGEKYGDGTCAVPCDLIISAEFGTWGGDIDRNQLPSHLYVDFVRVYEEYVNP